MNSKEKATQSEQLKILSKDIVFTDDNWITVKTNLDINKYRFNRYN